MKHLASQFQKAKLNRNSKKDGEKDKSSQSYIPSVWARAGSVQLSDSACLAATGRNIRADVYHKVRRRE